MLDDSIKNKIEEKFGQPIRYSKDFEILASHISSVVGANISASTIKRLFGFVKSESKPTKYTLDIISRYISIESVEEIEISTTISTVEKSVEPSKKGRLLIIPLALIVIILILIIQKKQHSKSDNNSWKTLHALLKFENLVKSY